MTHTVRIEENGDCQIGIMQPKQYDARQFSLSRDATGLVTGYDWWPVKIVTVASCRNLSHVHEPAALCLARALEVASFLNGGQRPTWMSP